MLVIVLAKALCKQYIELFTVLAVAKKKKKDIGFHNQSYAHMLLDNLFKQLSFSHSIELLFIMSSCLLSYSKSCYFFSKSFNPLNPELNPICYLLALLGAHSFLHVSRIRVKSLTLRRLMS